jgi:hypothetical protein
MTRQLLIIIGITVLLAGCASPPEREDLTAEEEDQFVLDKSVCAKKADESTRGFGRKSITWELKHREIYDYCMGNKGWDKDRLLELEYK